MKKLLFLFLLSTTAFAENDYLFLQVDCAVVKNGSTEVCSTTLDQIDLERFYLNQSSVNSRLNCDLGAFELKLKYFKAPMAGALINFSKEQTEIAKSFMFYEIGQGTQITATEENEVDGVECQISFE